MTNLQANMVRCQFMPLRFSPQRIGIKIRTLLIAFFLATVSPTTVMSSETEGPELTVKVGVRLDAKPFSYVDVARASESILPGFSGYSIEVCRHVLKQMQKLPQYQNYTFTAVETTAETRFKRLGADGELFMLCGPDSISADRLLEFRSSHAVFLTGMTYAYVNPRSRNFPRGNYCEHIVGVVRGTTAAAQGLEDLSSRNLLMRFDKALDLEIQKMPDRVAESRQALLEITKDVLSDTQEEIKELRQPIEFETLTDKDRKKRRMLRLYKELNEINNTYMNTDPATLDAAIANLESEGMSIAGKIMDLYFKEYGNINARIAQEITTDECPNGFTSMPVRKYPSHDKGIAAFCKGEVLYYLADYDILKNKTQEIADCDIVMNRFTRSREVYGVYFPKQDEFYTNPGSDEESVINVASFYADFNYFLLLAMQGERSKLEDLFADEFGVQQKSEELERFFDGFKFYTP